MLGLYQYFSYNLPLKERFAMIRAAGFDTVGLWREEWLGWTGHREYADIARAAGLELCDGHAPFIRDYDIVNSLWLDNQDGETTFDIYKSAIIGCGEDGVKNLVVHLTDDFKGRAMPPPNSVGIERIKRLAGAAEKCGVTIALENLTIHGYLSYVFERASSPSLGFCYDAGHRNFAEPGVDLLSLYGDRLVALHLHDNDGSDDQHLIPFEGSIDWQEQMTKIQRTGYAGPTMLECTAGGPGSIEPNDPRTAEEWLSDALSAARRLDAIRNKAQGRTQE
jgi:sugar phosphate isomerase/epimerase